jgi:cellulose synthase/poly-beta-1,6-N-acetylglucosamine synthase-like glycosyltransferase
MLTQLGWTFLLSPVVIFVYAYFAYPALLRLLTAIRGGAALPGEPEAWPTITVTIPAYNEAGSIGRTIENVLAAEYPADRREILIVSDASTDGTDDVVRSYADRRVSLLRMPSRAGKTAAENAAAAHLGGAIVVNMDATIRLRPDSLRRLVRVFQDPTIGVASGRDVSVGDERLEGNQGESGYVGYEMWVRALETQVGGIVGASGCFYAIRRPLVQSLFPAALSRDFASPLLARRAGFRSVSVNDAVCFVPRTRSLKAEYRRKIRTMARGLETLGYLAALMNPLRYGLFAWMLVSHKLCRWLVFLLLPLAALGLLLLVPTSVPARWLFAAAAVGVLLGIAGMRWPEGRKPPLPVALCGFALASAVAGLLAWSKALTGERNPIWEPTRRPI